MLLKIGVYINYRIVIIMSIKTVCAVMMLLAFVSAGNSYADQKIKTKSNIKNDRVAQPVANSECADKCGEGEQCIKLPVDNTVSAATDDATCVAVSETKTVVESKDTQ
jgi:hypothetical protein